MIQARTVQGELIRRGECRYGLQGVKIEHKGKQYVCEGSEWDDRGELRLTLIPVEQWEEWSVSETEVMNRGPISMAELDAWEPNYPKGTIIDAHAEESILRSVWPVVCCAPKIER